MKNGARSKKIINLTIVPRGLHLDKNKTVVSSCGLFRAYFYFENIEFIYNYIGYYKLDH